MINEDKILDSFHITDARLNGGGRVFRVKRGIEKIGDNLFPNYIHAQKDLIKKYQDDERSQIYQTRLDMLDEIEAIILPNSLLSIGEGAFKGLKNLTLINLPEKLESIGTKAFYGCENLQEVCIPKSVKKLGSGAFEKCDGLVKVFLPTGLKLDKGDIFWDCSHVEFFRYNKEKDQDHVEEETIDSHVILSTDSPFYQYR